MKALYVVATMMNPNLYDFYQRILLEKSLDALYDFKMSEDIFTFPGHDAISMLQISELAKGKIRKELGQILYLVRNLTDVDSVPPYTEIINGFKACPDYIDTTLD